MSHTYVSQLLHCVFSTKERQAVINSALQERLWPYIGGIARENGMKALAIGGTEDHIHLLLSLPATIPVAKAMQLIKGGSSKWVHEKFPEHNHFAWQEGYGAFSISISDIERTIAYIHGQAEHHRRRSFREELIAFLKAHLVDYDERYVCE